MINKQKGLQTSLPQDFDVLSKTLDEKLYKKQKIVRDEFPLVGKYGFPLIKKQKIDIDKIDLWGYSKTKADDFENANKTIHFFTYDWKFESVYEKPEKAMEKLGQYYALCTPDFSLYTNMSQVLQMYSTFKNRWCGAFWQRHSKLVIPTMCWSNEDSFEYCFSGVEEGSIVAVSTYQAENYQDGFMVGYNKMLEVIKPEAVICYGQPFEGMGGNIKFIDPFDHEKLIKQMGLDEYAKKYMAGEVYPSR